MSTHSISPMGKGVKPELYNPLPVNCGLQMPPPLAPGAYGRKLEPLSTLNIAETQNRVRQPSAGKMRANQGAGYHRPNEAQETN